MKKLFFIILLFPLFSIAQDKISLLLESNINYAPFGIKILIQNDTSKVGAFFTMKLSEDCFFRSVDKNSTMSKYNEDAAIMDINEFIVNGGVVLKIATNIDFYGGLGVLMGNKFIYKSSLTNPWVKTNSMIMMPMASFGIVLTRNRFKISIGNETAVTRETHYMQSILNDKSFARLSSITFGFGYTFGKK